MSENHPDHPDHREAATWRERSWLGRAVTRWVGKDLNRLEFDKPDEHVRLDHEGHLTVDSWSERYSLDGPTAPGSPVDAPDAPGAGGVDAPVSPITGSANDDVQRREYSEWQSVPEGWTTLNPVLRGHMDRSQAVLQGEDDEQRVLLHRRVTHTRRVTPWLPEDESLARLQDEESLEGIEDPEEQIKALRAALVYTKGRLRSEVERASVASPEGEVMLHRDSSSLRITGFTDGQDAVQWATVNLPKSRWSYYPPKDSDSDTHLHFPLREKPVWLIRAEAIEEVARWVDQPDEPTGEQGVVTSTELMLRAAAIRAAGSVLGDAPEDREFIEPSQDLVLEGETSVSFEDGGQCAIVELNTDDDHPVFARLISYVDGGNQHDHQELMNLRDHRVRVTVERLSSRGEE